MHRALIFYDMDVYGIPSPHNWQYIDQNTVRHKSSHGTKMVSSLRFGVEPRRGTAIGTGIAAPLRDHFDIALKDSEISLAETVTHLGDEEAQLHEVPSIIAHENL
jgi:hypothetical protein